MPQPAPRPDWQRLFAPAFGLFGLPIPECELRPYEDRRWRLDFAWPLYMVALEVQGGAWIGKGHGKPKRQAEDREKLNTLQSRGWIVLQCDPDELKAMSVVPFIDASLLRRGYTYRPRSRTRH